jgi:hypothetical protein
VPTSKILLAPVLEARPLASEVRLILLRPLLIPDGRTGGGTGAGEKYGSEEPLCEEGTVAIVPWLEKLRIAWRAGGRGTVLVLLRLRLWFEKRGTWGASAARSSSAGVGRGISGTGSGVLPKDRLPLGMGRGRPFATRIESRIGLRRRLAVGGVGEPISPCGAGGTAARSCRPIEEWLRKERAVSQT